jgi:formylglycine-generating enzyme required for sulfatase activity
VPPLGDADTLRPPGQQRAPAPNQTTPLFILESRKAENLARVRARRTRIVLGVLFLMLIGTGVGWWKYPHLEDAYYFHIVMGGTALTGGQERALKPKDEFAECKKGCPSMVVVPAGSFTMGSPESEKDRFDNEGPQQVDVTFAEWDACVDTGACRRASDSGWGRADRPVINVSWDDAKLYVAWLRRMTGKQYRLLSEAEREYAARAGTTTHYYWGDDIGKDNAKCDGCASQWDARQTAPVGSFKPNAFGLYDMHGNVGQWVEDCLHNSYTGAPSDGTAWTEDCSYRVFRGGNWASVPRFLRAANRGGSAADNRSLLDGFRARSALRSSPSSGWRA